MVVLATLIGVLGSITVATPTGAATLTIPATTSCAQPNPANGLLAVEPSGGELPVGASATLGGKRRRTSLKKGTNRHLYRSPVGQTSLNVKQATMKRTEHRRLTRQAYPAPISSIPTKMDRGPTLCRDDDEPLRPAGDRHRPGKWVQPVDCGVASTVVGLDKHSSFRGAAYTSLVFSRRVAELELDQSFGTTGDCYDCAAVESFFATLKREPAWVHGTERWADPADLRLAHSDYIQGFYNSQRTQSRLGYRSPIEFEEAVA